MRRSIIALFALALAASACASSGATGAPPEGGATTLGRSGGVVFGPAQPAIVGDAQKAAVPVPANQAATGQGVPVPLAFDPDRALILTASIAMRAKDPWGASDRAQAIAIGLGGDVMGLSQSGSGDARTANLTLRVPSARFNEALRQLRDLADVEVTSSSVDGKDVTEQFVDLDARLVAKKAEEQRYLALLARADKIDDILKIDQTLAVVRTQIEQLTGQLNSIKQRTQFSTITVSVTPAAAPIPITDPKAYDPSKTAQAALATLASLFRVVADVAIWTLVFGWIPLMVLAAALVLQRTRRTTGTAA